jgi:hypothetical protein
LVIGLIRELITGIDRWAFSEVVFVSDWLNFFDIFWVVRHVSLLLGMKKAPVKGLGWSIWLVAFVVWSWG